MKSFLKHLPKALFSLAVGGAAVGKLTQAEPLVQSFAALGYPTFLLTILGGAYVIGLVAIWQPKFPRLQEWAFAGFTIAMIGAFSSHILGGDPFAAAAPSLVLLALLAAAYRFTKPQL